MAERTRAGRIKVVFAFLLLFGPAILLIIMSTRGCEHKFKELDDYGAGIDYKFTDARGKQLSSKDFENNVVLITTLQPTCPDSCAITMWHLKQSIYNTIYKNKKKLGSVRIVSFVTDGNGNDVEDVSQVYEMIQDQVVDYDPDIWYIASGESREVFNFENNDQTLLQEGEEYFGGQGYQELMLLMDRENHLRMVLPGSTEGMVRRMKECVALLQKQYDKADAKKDK